MASWTSSISPSRASLSNSDQTLFSSTTTPEHHNEYIKITDPNAQCSVCRQYFTTSMQKCCLCGYKTCFQCHINHQYDDKHILDGLGLDWSFIERGCHLQNTGVVSAPAAQAQAVIREWNFMERTIQDRLERRGTATEEQTHEIQDTDFQAPFHLPHQREFPLGGVNIIDEASPGANAGYGQSPTSTLTCGVKWNHGAFPRADQDLFTKVLVEGGKNTIKLYPMVLSSDDLPLMLYHAATSKALLRQDQWIIDNPSDFEQQWSFIENVIQEWNEDEVVNQEKSKAGDLSALDMLEAAFSLRAISHGVPQGSFWVFWVAGMRQALQGPDRN